ncbi:hypothetical protein [Bartonella saheliensis]|nr:hypothetical protein [Bartonella saheliensis]
MGGDAVVRGLVRGTRGGVVVQGVGVLYNTPAKCMELIGDDLYVSMLHK